MIRYYIIFSLVLFFLGNSVGQNVVADIDYPTHEFGLNTGALVFQFIPFKSNATQTGPYDFHYLYRNKQRAFIISFGITNQDDFFGSAHYNIRMGNRKFKTMTEHWEFFRGLDIILTSGGFNRPIDVNSDYSAAGIGFPLGIRYNFNKHISVFTEGIFFVAITSNVNNGSFSKIQAIPPLSISFSARL